MSTMTEYEKLRRTHVENMSTVQTGEPHWHTFPRMHGGKVIDQCPRWLLSGYGNDMLLLSLRNLSSNRTHSVEAWVMTEINWMKYRRKEKAERKEDQVRDLIGGSEPVEWLVKPKIRYVGSSVCALMKASCVGGSHFEPLSLLGLLNESLSTENRIQRRME
jgi:hypothetical protein